MYLSRLILNPYSDLVQQHLANPYALHRQVMRAFPDDLEPNAERVLFRVEIPPYGRVNRLPVLVQSWQEPDWSWLPAPSRRGYLLEDDGPNPAVKPLPARFVAGRQLAFRLFANPTRRCGRTRRRVGLYLEAEQQTWLLRKAGIGGFRLVQASITRTRSVPMRIRRKADGESAAWWDDPDLPAGSSERLRPRLHQVTMLGVLYEGVLQVIDPVRFLHTIKQGVGSGKGLGFGLLSVAAPR